MKKVLTHFINFVLGVTIFIFVIILIVKTTVLNEKYIFKTLEDNYYYSEIYDIIINNFESNLIQSGLDDNIIYELITKEKVENDVKTVLQGIYHNIEINIDTNILTKNLNNKVDEIFKSLHRTPNKEEQEDIGIIFESGLMDNAKSCKNKCIFCFIDQLPKGMRKSLYFKDDDSRLSFLQGNYVTLTNMSEEDINHIIFYHLSPINVSIHTTDLELRKKMLKNPRADKVLDVMKTLANAGIEMNLQVVLCRGINDGKILDKTIEDCAVFFPHAKSMSVVPIGLTKYRENLYTMIPFDKQESKKVIAQVEYWQKKLKKSLGTSFVFLSDEFYLKAEYPLPDCADYEDFTQYEIKINKLK